MDKWFAECVPCRWRTAHDTEDAAIAAAEDHVSANHAKVQPAERARQVMGHVQFRSENAVGYEFADLGARAAASVAAAQVPAEPAHNPPLPAPEATPPVQGDGDPTGTQ